jgi:hypothetical protein
MLQSPRSAVGGCPASPPAAQHNCSLAGRNHFNPCVDMRCGAVCKADIHTHRHTHMHVAPETEPTNVQLGVPIG